MIAEDVAGYTYCNMGSTGFGVIAKYGQNNEAGVITVVSGSRFFMSFMPLIEG